MQCVLFARSCRECNAVLTQCWLTLTGRGERREEEETQQFTTGNYTGDERCDAGDGTGHGIRDGDERRIQGDGEVKGEKWWERLGIFWKGGGKHFIHRKSIVTHR